MNAETAAITMMWAEIAVAIGIFAAGILAGLFFSRFGSGVRGQVHKLEKQLADERENARRYHESVAEHFKQTSDMFGELTHKYTALYTHLAEGARSLCADRAPGIGSAFENAALIAASSSDTDASATASTADPAREAAPASETTAEAREDEGERAVAVAIDSTREAEQHEANGHAKDEDEPRPAV